MLCLLGTHMNNYCSYWTIFIMYYSLVTALRFRPGLPLRRLVLRWQHL